MVQTDSDPVRAPGDSDAHADAARSRRFQQMALPHLDAAYNLARWLCGNPNDADDVVQEAFMRAFRFFDTFRGDTARPWLLAIVRRTWYTEWRRRASSHETVEFDDTMDDATFDGWSAGGDDPQTLLIRDEDTRQVHEALAQLPVEYREVLILREIEEMGYREIAMVADVPIGTVMSRLARGRRKLAAVLTARQGGSAGRLPKSGASHDAPSQSPRTRCSGSDDDLPANPRLSADARSATGDDAAQAVPPLVGKAAASATVTPLRASANGRPPLNAPGGTAAGHAQETPDGL
ncbi:RNA polymerase sigma factor [Paraburkholderia sp. BCC1884]|uniref:RNA polymerase sigma factor n=1 Tax=Paraburkholderia sp. BCC1884 TaxID=2562668 RepID=UPI0011846088|nr:RNA polymerase sigma factor [Paraburkholderia sp. BCC1884]